jgi:hypothetical protein
VSSSKNSSIKTFADLKAEKLRLRSEISQIESDFKSNPLLKIGNALLGKDKHPNSPYSHPLSFLTKKNNSILSTSLINTTESLLGTFLISNKLTRKYYIGYTIAREMIPFAIQKFNEIFKQKTKFY